MRHNYLKNNNLLCFVSFGFYPNLLQDDDATCVRKELCLSEPQINWSEQLKGF